jgi:copper(I)-binding protein
LKKLLIATMLLLNSQVFAEGTFDNAYVRDLIPGRNMSAGFFEFTNEGEEDIVLVGASSSGAASVEMHTHVQEDGMMKMRRMPSLTVAPKERVVFQPGGNHLMLFDCDPAAFADGQVELVLTDAQGEEYRVKAEVRSPHKMHH